MFSKLPKVVSFHRVFFYVCASENVNNIDAHYRFKMRLFQCLSSFKLCREEVTTFDYCIFTTRILVCTHQKNASSAARKKSNSVGVICCCEFTLLSTHKSARSMSKTKQLLRMRLVRYEVVIPERNRRRDL